MNADVDLARRRLIFITTSLAAFPVPRSSGSDTSAKGRILVWSLASAKGRARLVQEAARSRLKDGSFLCAAGLALIYNLVGALDIVSTNASIASGAGEEVNPVMRAAMENFGEGWVGAKLFLQAVITAMVLWFPHRLVLGIFAVGIVSNAAVVANNFRIFFTG